MVRGVRPSRDARLAVPRDPPPALPAAAALTAAGSIRALVFDFDGLILETESPAFESWAEIYRDHGFELPRERWLENIGASVWPFDALDHLASLVTAPFDRVAIKARREARKSEILATLEAVAGVRDYFADAAKLGLRIAVASSASESYVCAHLERLALREGIATVICRDHVARGKPAPDLYLRALADLGVAAGEALAFEDSPNGVAAAKAAGLRCVAVPNAITAGLDLSAADLVLASLGDLPLARLLARLDSSPGR